tara:strand:+ start:1 stop:1284 length:1284 start_codon:yes stop_codon:yes gene_type:complete
MLKVVELFAGVGGFRIGLEKTKKFEVIWSNQWEPLTKNQQHASWVYENKFGKKNHSNENIEEVDTKVIPDCDVLVGGFPCQDYSVATTLKNSKGLKGKKGVLWWSIERILREKKKKPKYLILENVDRLLKSPSKQRGRDFAVMLSCLNKLDYAVEWRVINAAEYGFPQRRRRVFILGYHKSTKKYKDLLKNPKEWIVEKGTLAKGFPVKKFDKGDILDIKIKGSLKSISDSFGKKDKVSQFKNTGVCVKNKILTYKSTPEFKRNKKNSKNLGDILQDEKDVDNSYYINKSKKVTPKKIKQIDGTVIEIKNEWDKWNYLKGKKSEWKVNKSLGYRYKYGEGKMIFPDDLEKPSRTIITGEGGVSPSRFKHIVKKPKSDERRLTPIELERLNGFPDNHTKLDGVTDAKRAFFMGNALVCGVVEKIGASL